MILPIVVTELAAIATAIPVNDGALIPRSKSDPFPMPSCNGIDIEDATIEELQRWMILGRLTSEDLVSCYCVGDRKYTADSAA